MKYIIFNIIIFSFLSFSQNRVGQWSAHLSYNEGNCVFNNENIIYVGTKSQYFTYNLSDNSIESFSKINNMNDVNVTAINFDNQTNTLIIGYENGNIDLIKNKQVVNIPYIKNSSNIFALLKFYKHIFSNVRFFLHLFINSLLLSKNHHFILMKISEKSIQQCSY